MKKLFLLVLALALVLGLLGCASKEPEVTQTEDKKQTADMSQINPPETADPDAALKAELLEKYDGRFQFYLAFDMQLINFTFDEATVVRQHFDSMKDEQPKHNGTWDIVDGELVVTGEWNEAFIINLESNIATSKTDGREYPIYKTD